MVSIGGRSRVSTRRSTPPAGPRRSARGWSDSCVVGDAGPAQRGEQHRHGLGRELVERPVAVLADAEVGLGERVDAVTLGEVDQQADLDAPALDERHRLEQRAPARVLAGERLHEPGEVRGTAR